MVWLIQKKSKTLGSRSIIDGQSGIPSGPGKKLIVPSSSISIVLLYSIGSRHVVSSVDSFKQSLTQQLPHYKVGFANRNGFMAVIEHIYSTHRSRMPQTSTNGRRSVLGALVGSYLASSIITSVSSSSICSRKIMSLGTSPVWRTWPKSSHRWPRYPSSITGGFSSSNLISQRKRWPQMYSVLERPNCRPWLHSLDSLCPTIGTSSFSTWLDEEGTVLTRLFVMKFVMNRLFQNFVMKQVSFLCIVP